MSKMERTRELIMQVLEKGPARSSDIRQSVVAIYPDAAMTAIQDLYYAGRITRLTNERNAIWKVRHHGKEITDSS